MGTALRSFYRNGSAARCSVLSLLERSTITRVIAVNRCNQFLGYAITRYAHQPSEKQIQSAIDYLRSKADDLKNEYCRVNEEYADDLRKIAEEVDTEFVLEVDLLRDANELNHATNTLSTYLLELNERRQDQLRKEMAALKGKNSG